MIAPLRRASTETIELRGRLRRARRVVASAFFNRDRKPPENAPPISAWRAWLFAGWVVIVTGAYFAATLGLF